MISMDKKYRTRDGKPVRVLTVTQGPIERPVVGVINNIIASTWFSNGKNDCGRESKFDLIEVRSAEDVVREVVTHYWPAASNSDCMRSAERIVAALREANLLKEDV